MDAHVICPIHLEAWKRVLYFVLYCHCLTGYLVVNHLKAWFISLHWCKQGLYLLQWGWCRGFSWPGTKAPSPDPVQKYPLNGDCVAEHFFPSSSTEPNRGVHDKCWNCTSARGILEWNQTMIQPCAYRLAVIRPKSVMFPLLVINQCQQMPTQCSEGHSLANVSAVYIYVGWYWKCKLL